MSAHHDDLEAVARSLAAQEEPEAVILDHMRADGVLTTGTSPYFVCCFWCQEPVFQHDTVYLIEDQLCCSGRCALRAWEEQYGR